MDEVIDARTYHFLRKKFTEFFEERGFVEIPTQTRRSILAACEDPRTVVSFTIGGEKWPLPQTGQMWLETELLKNGEHGDIPGVFCSTTSYRDEPSETFIDGRHDRMFPMFEFESRGNEKDMIKLEKEFLAHLSFPDGKDVHYQHACNDFCIDVIGNPEEQILGERYGSVIFLGRFPERTEPFWNMKKGDDGYYNKVDVLLHGMETIGSAERSCDAEKMRERFYSVSRGEYADLLFKEFGRERVERELKKYLAMEMFPRFGGGIGATRLARAMRMSELMPDYAEICE